MAKNDDLIRDADCLENVATIADYCSAVDPANAAAIDADAVVLRAWSLWLRTLVENEVSE